MKANSRGEKMGKTTALLSVLLMGSEWAPLTAQMKEKSRGSLKVMLKVLL